MTPNQLTQYYRRQIYASAATSAICFLWGYLCGVFLLKRVGILVDVIVTLLGAIVINWIFRAITPIRPVAK